MNNAKCLCTIVILLFLLFAVSVHQSEAFSALRNDNKVTVTPVTTPTDVMALADLRYDEWIAPSHQSDDNGNIQRTPSRYAFRMATAELVEERSRATAFLARLEEEEENGENTSTTTPVVVGAAELSPIEFEGAIDATISNAHRLLYVTDVVTSSKFRRRGVAHALMDALEQSAYDQCGDEGTLLFLHVKSVNEAAQQFYASDRRRYKVPTADQLRGIRVDRLEENAGTAGQILLCKALVMQGQTTIQGPGKARVVTGFGTKFKTPGTKKLKHKKK
eukprot:scaffold3063_cov191-Amphora_coffeaeformis.AAC.1